MPAGLDAYWAKSPSRAQAAGEALTAHLRAVAEAAMRFCGRVGPLPAGGQGGWRIQDPSRRRDCVVLAALLHDAGKIAVGFQLQVANPSFAHLAGQAGTPLGGIWGQRHEVLSLGFVDLLLDGDDRKGDVAALVASHHLPLASRGAFGGGRTLAARYGDGHAVDELLGGQTILEGAVPTGSGKTTRT